MREKARPGDRIWQDRNYGKLPAFYTRLPVVWVSPDPFEKEALNHTSPKFVRTFLILHNDQREAYRKSRSQIDPLDLELGYTSRSFTVCLRRPHPSTGSSIGDMARNAP